MKLRINETINLKEALVKREDYGKITEAVKPNFPKEVQDLLSREDVAVIGVIKAGWSINKRYYSTELISKLPPLLLTEGAIQFLDHLKEEEGTVLNRSVNELVSYTKYAWYDPSTKKVYAAVMFPLTKVDTAWVHEVIKNDPDKMGVSISSYVEAEENFVFEGITGIKVTEWVYFESADYVLFPSAGGSGIATKEEIKKMSENISVQTKRNIITGLPELTQKDLFTEAKNIQEALTRDLKTLVDSKIHQDYFDRVLYSLQEIFWEILYYNTVSPDERATELKKAFEQAYAILAELEFIKGKQTKESTNTVNQRGDQMKTAEELRREFPELVSLIEKEALVKADFDKVNKEVESLKGEVAELKKNLESSINAKTAIEQEKVTIQKALDEIKAKEAKVVRTALIEDLIKKHSVPQELVTERFKNKLFEMDEASVEAEIKDRIVGLNLSTVIHSVDKDSKTTESVFNLDNLVEALTA